MLCVTCQYRVICVVFPSGLFVVGRRQFNSEDQRIIHLQKILFIYSPRDNLCQKPIHLSLEASKNEK